jgi:hypothetical protein
MLAASAAALPWLLAAAGCRSQDVFTGPDPLAGRPPLGHNVVTLQAVIAAEENLVDLYRAAITSGAGTAARSRVLGSLLAQHEHHLARLRARLVLPAGAPTSAASPTSPGPSARSSASAAPARVTIAQLRAAENASAAGLVQRLATVEPALAQLFASIAASDATHVTVLAEKGLGG